MKTVKTVSDYNSEIDEMMRKFDANKNKNSQKQLAEELQISEKEKKNDEQKKENIRRSDRKKVSNHLQILKQKQNEKKSLFKKQQEKKQTEKQVQQKKSLFKKQQEQKRVYQSQKQKRAERIKIRPHLNKFHRKSDLKKIDTINEKKSSIIKRANNAAAGSLKEKDLEAAQVVSQFRKDTENFNPNKTRKNENFSIAEIYQISRNLKELDKNLDKLLENYEKETESSLQKLNRGLTEKLNDFQKAMENRNLDDTHHEKRAERPSQIFNKRESLNTLVSEKFPVYEENKKSTEENKKPTFDEKIEKISEKREEFEENLKKLDDKKFDRISETDFDKTNVKGHANELGKARDSIFDKSSDEYKDFSLKFIDAKIVENDGYNPAGLDAWGERIKKQIAEDENKFEKINDINKMVEKFKEKYSARVDELIESKILKKDLYFTDDKAKEILWKNLGANKNILLDENIKAFEKKEEKSTIAEKMEKLKNPEKKEEFLQQKQKEEIEKRQQEELTQQHHQQNKIKQ